MIFYLRLAECFFHGLHDSYWEVSQQTYVQISLASLGVVRWQNSDLQGGVGQEGFGRKMGVA